MDIRDELRAIKAQAAKTDEITKRENALKLEEENKKKAEESKKKIDVNAEWSTPAAPSVNFKLVSSAEDFNNQSLAFHPDYTHQVFEGEVIKGHKDPKVNVYFTSSSMKPFFSFSSAEKQHDLATDARQCLTSKLPKGVQFIHNSDEFIKIAEQDSLNFKPPGSIISTYRVNDKEGNEVEYEVRKGTFDQPNVLSFHSRMEMLVLFFIDASCLISASDNDWEVYYIFEKQEKYGQTKYSFVGFTSVYKFYAYPNKIRKRISQALILPPFQGKNHGFYLLKAIYADSKLESVKDITVEDPSDAFTGLRDVVDCTLITKLGYFQEDPEDQPTKQEIDELTEKLKLNKNQIKHCFEIFWYKTTDKRNESEYRHLRLAVKRRIYKEFADILSGIDNADDKKKHIADIYRDQEKSWDRTLQKLEETLKLP
eukprot:TRINITY_DN3372_c0_g1_i1.p1 TRINITY_DN3372_c0_g1~~TRINITY_DN3372_c0_g1_i1.p1  ORF type:complete len:425 (+),score=162.04 TRINITY_DN3372_c0_g1_i1:366-1640(+)